MIKSKAQYIVEKMKPALLSEGSTSADAASYAKLILPLVEQVMLESFIPQVTDVQPMEGPTGRIATLYSVYSGADISSVNETHCDTSYILILDKTAGFVAGTVLTISTGTFTVIYAGGNKALIAKTTGTYVPVKTATFVDNSITYTIMFSSPNRACIKKLLTGFSGDTYVQNTYPIPSYATGYAYGNDTYNIRNLSFETRTHMIETVSRKLKSKFSVEQLTEWIKLYNEKGVDLGSKYLAHEIRNEIDKEFIQYLKFIAKYTVLSTTKLDLGASIAASPSGALQDVTSDIVTNVFLAAEQIIKDTKRNRNIFVLADPVTCAFLQVNPFMVKGEAYEDNPYRFGTLGTYPVYCDLFADTGEYFVLVGYRGSNEGDGDSGVIYAPYTTTIHQATDTDFKEAVMCMNRYKFVRHPQDSGNKNQSNIWDSTNANNSDFFKMFLIDYGTTELINFSDTTLSNFE